MLQLNKQKSSMMVWYSLFGLIVKGPYGLESVVESIAICRSHNCPPFLKPNDSAVTSSSKPMTNLCTGAGLVARQILLHSLVFLTARTSSRTSTWPASSDCRFSGRLECLVGLFMFAELTMCPVSCVIN